MARKLLDHFDLTVVGSLKQNSLQTFERTAGIILAAGGLTRYGSPKQLLDWKGKPFVKKIRRNRASSWTLACGDCHRQPRR